MTHIEKKILKCKHINEFAISQSEQDCFGQAVEDGINGKPCRRDSLRPYWQIGCDIQELRKQGLDGHAILITLHDRIRFRQQAMLI